MRTIAILLAALVLGAAGCGKSDKSDNSNVQTPNDQPIGAPQPLGAGAAGPLNSAPAALPANGKGKALPTPNIEIKQ